MASYLSLEDTLRRQTLVEIGQVVSENIFKYTLRRTDRRMTIAQSAQMGHSDLKG